MMWILLVPWLLLLVCHVLHPILLMIFVDGLSLQLIVFPWLAWFFHCPLDKFLSICCWSSWMAAGNGRWDCCWSKLSHGTWFPLLLLFAASRLIRSIRWRPAPMARSIERYKARIVLLPPLYATTTGVLYSCWHDMSYLALPLWP
jgi:hypothetical protein